MPMSGWLGGSIADLPTPFDDHDRLDLAAVATLCARQICAGATALLVTDTGGEAWALSSDERTALVRAAVDAARGRIAVIAGVTSNATATAICQARDAATAGADAVMAVVPYYNKPTQAGIVQHFRAIAAASTRPVILHDAPSRCVRGLDDETVVQLAALPTVIGLRDDAGDITRVLRLRPHLPPGFALLTGDDATAAAYMLTGGDGCVSAVAALMPQLCRGVFLASRRGHAKYAATLLARLAPLTAALPDGLTPAAIKSALARRGLLAPHVRLPLTPLCAADSQRVADGLATLGAIAQEAP